MISGQSQGDRPRCSRSSLTLQQKRTHKKTSKQQNLLCEYGPNFTELLFRTYDFNEELLRNYSKITKKLGEHCHRHPKRQVIHMYQEPNALQTRTLFWSANTDVAQVNSRKVHFQSPLGNSLEVYRLIKKQAPKTQAWTRLIY